MEGTNFFAGTKTIILSGVPQEKRPTAITQECPSHQFFLTSQGQLKPANVHRLAHVSNVHQRNLSRRLFKELPWGCQHQLRKKKLFWWSYRR